MKKIYMLLFSMVLIACGNSEKTEESVIETDTHTDKIVISQAQFEGEQMALGSLTAFDFNTIIKASGMIDVPPHSKSSIATMVGGYISKTPLLIGDRVKKGQLLVTLKNIEYIEIQQNYLEVAEQLHYLKSEFERQKTLFEEKITSEKSYLKAESVYKSNLAHYNGLRKKLQMMHLDPINVEQGNISSTINIYAAIDGFVTKMNVSNGSYVSPSDVILELVDTAHIHLELSVFEKDILKIKKGQKIQFKIPESSKETYNAEVHLVGTTIDEQSRRVKIHGHVDTNEAHFILGMFVEADIIIDSAKVLGLPKEAVIALEDDFFVIVQEEADASGFHFRKIKVETGRENENFVEVLNAEALKEHQILIRGTSMLLNDSEGGHGH
ncbi:efflux RND transporter periplasmic adaptor subunit [Mariniflexile ostreae]|uniref:Efflux RND transporter periplasmic adaptor subunit n=1 Tax=Mariniflexile ostreae TaxID=1520892 RepID=A0ABV5F9C2_9FLAO